MEQFEGIRRDSRDRGMSIRALAERHGVHRRTVRQALADATPPARKVPERSAPATGPYVDLVRRWLMEDLSAPRKQRHTARRIWQRLVEEEDARIGESTVRNLVARLRIEIGADRCQVMVPQTHPPAAEAEVDFGEFTASIAGQVMKLYMFCMRLSHSGKAFHFGYANQTQESFLDGHVRAFEAFGGVPTGMIRYDNLKPAVIRIALGRERFEHPRFVAMRSHYGYDSFFCVPGVEGAHEKGGVEGEIGRFRRRHLTPIPHVGSLEALNAALAAADARDDAPPYHRPRRNRRRGGRTTRRHRRPGRAAPGRHLPDQGGLPRIQGGAVRGHRPGRSPSLPRPAASSSASSPRNTSRPQPDSVTPPPSHGAQGVSADTMHGLLSGQESRQQLYTMLTRGRTANHLYLQVVGDGDPHTAHPTRHDLTANADRDAAADPRPR